MYPPPINIIRQLEQGVVECVTYGKYTIHIGFESGDNLSILGPFRFGPADRLADARINEFPLADSILIRILGCSVTETVCDEDGTLSLRFSNEDWLIVYANDPMYEAYTLLIRGNEYVV